MPASGWIANVVTDAPIESVWGNSIRDRTVTPFLNAAQRTSSIAAPIEGMLTWLIDVNRLEVYDGTAWVAATSEGRRLGYAQLTANTGAFAAFPGGNIGLTVTVPGMTAGRLLVATAEANLAVATNASLAIRINGVQVAQGNAFNNTYMHLTGRATSVAGTNTVELWGWATGTTTISATATSPAFLAVHDEGV